MLFSIDSRHAGRRTRNLLETMYAGQGRIAFKGQLFSAPMDWNSLLTQLQKMEAEEIQISLPVLGAVLAARVRISITSGLIDLNKLLRHATVRRNIVVQLIRMQRDARHPDFRNVNMDAVIQRAHVCYTVVEGSTSFCRLLYGLEGSEQHELTYHTPVTCPMASK